MPDDSKQPQEGDPTGQAPAANNATPTTAATTQAGQAPDSVETLPDWARKLIVDLRVENATHRTAKQRADDEAKAAEDRRLEQERKFEELAQQRAARIAELEPIATRYNALAEKLSADLEREIAKLPAELKALRPEHADLDALIEWADKAKQLAAKMQAAASPGHGTTPKAASPDARPAQTQAQAIAAMRSRF